MSSNPLEGMTQAKWDALSSSERDAIRDNSDLHPKLLGLEGWRVEVMDAHGERRRFIVGKSTGWRPCHVELARRDSPDGVAASFKYASVIKLYKVR